MYVLQYCSLEEAEDSIHTWNDKGIALDELEKYAEAIACFDEVIKLDPENSKAWINKGIALSSLERYEEVVACSDEAIRLDPEYSKTWYNKGIALLRLERYEEAIACFDEAIRLDPEYLLALYAKGNLLRKLGRDEEAEQCLAKARELQQCQKVNQGYTFRVILSELYFQYENHNLKSNQFVNLTLKNTTITHDCEMLEYWTEKTFPDGST